MVKQKKDDAAELEPAQNVPDEAGAGAADDAGAAGAGQASEAEAGDAAAGDEVAADAAPAGEVPGAADADAHAADGAQPEAADEAEAPIEQTDAPRNRIDINVLAACSAASLAFGTTEEDTTALPRFAVDWLGARGGDHVQAAALCAGAFLRRDTAMLVQPETLVIHLRRSGFPDVPEATGRVAVAWKVFAFALAELDALDRAEAEAAQKRAEAATGPRAARREELAMVPADPNPLTDLGRRLQGRG